MNLVRFQWIFGIKNWDLARHGDPNRNPWGWNQTCLANPVGNRPIKMLVAFLNKGIVWGCWFKQVGNPSGGDMINLPLQRANKPLWEEPFVSFSLSHKRNGAWIIAVSVKCARQMTRPGRWEHGSHSARRWHSKGRGAVTGGLRARLPSHGSFANQSRKAKCCAPHRSAMGGSLPDLLC